MVTKTVRRSAGGGAELKVLAVATANPDLVVLLLSALA